MAVKCILTGQTPSVLDGVTENVQTQLNDKVDKVTGKGLSTNDYTDAEKTKLSGIETGAQKNTITGVKGNAETTYRTGNVNITATNIGLGNVNNTSDANKPISNATQAALNGKQSKITVNGVLKGDGSGNISAATAADIPGLSGKQATITGAATTITGSNLTANRALVSNSSGKVAVSSVTSTELGYLDGVTSNIQTQLNNKLSSAPVTSVNNKTGAVSLGAKDVGAQSKITANGILKGDGSGNITAANETEVELVSLPNICNPNLLDNWYFGKPVNQHGQTSWNTAGYHLDRWYQEGAGNGHVGSGGCTFPGSTTTIQKIEKETYEVYRGNTFTISALLSTNELIFGTGVWTDSSEVTAKKDDNSLFVKAAAFPAANSYQACRIYSDTGADNTILAVKLELGSQQTLAHQENGVWVLNEIPDYEEQLRRCQRYQIVISGKDQPASVGIGVSRSATEIVVEIPLPTTLRISPACTLEGEIVLRNGANFFYATAIISVDMVGPGDVKIKCVASGMTVGTVYEAYLSNNPVSKITINANI